MKKDLDIFPRRALAKLQSFQPGLPDRPVPELRRMLGRDDVAKLSYNESPYGPSPLVGPAVNAALGQLNLYHDPEGKELRTKLAGFYNVDPDMVFLANGADEAITLAAQAFLAPGDEALVPAPSFQSYAVAARLMDAEPVRIPVNGETMAVDLNALAGAVTDRTKLIYLCNPNNPTGVMFGGDELKSFMRRIPSRVIVFLDEAYAEYVTDVRYQSGMGMLAEFRNLIVVRTFSKIYALAALRLGYGVCDPEVNEMIQRVRSPYNVNLLAQAAALASIDDAGFRERIAALNAKERQRVSEGLEELGFKVYPSQTNFVFADTRRDSGPLCQALTAYGIIIRPGYGYSLPSHVRISLGTREQNDRLLRALGEVLMQN